MEYHTKTIYYDFTIKKCNRDTSLELLEKLLDLLDFFIRKFVRKKINILLDSLLKTLDKKNHLLNDPFVKSFALLHSMLLKIKGNNMKIKNKIIPSKYKKNKHFLILEKRKNKKLDKKIIYSLKTFIINNKSKLDVLEKEPGEHI